MMMLLQMRTRQLNGGNCGYGCYFLSVTLFSHVVFLPFCINCVVAVADEMYVDDGLAVSCFV
jgi:hypothetical protein